MPQSWSKRLTPSSHCRTWSTWGAASKPYQPNSQLSASLGSSRFSCLKWRHTEACRSATCLLLVKSTLSQVVLMQIIGWCAAGACGHPPAILPGADIFACRGALLFHGAAANAYPSWCHESERPPGARHVVVQPDFAARRPLSQTVDLFEPPGKQIFCGATLNCGLPVFVCSEYEQADAKCGAVWGGHGKGAGEADQPDPPGFKGSQEQP